MVWGDYRQHLERARRRTGLGRRRTGLVIACMALRKAAARRRRRVDSHGRHGRGRVDPSWPGSRASPERRIDEIRARRFERAGGRSAPHSWCRPTGRLQGSSPIVAAAPDGSFVVVWRALSQDGDDTGIFGQRFDAVARRLGREFQINTHVQGAQKQPAVAVGATGAFTVVWTSEGQDGSGDGVFGQRYDRAGRRDGPELAINLETRRPPGLPVRRDRPRRRGGGGLAKRSWKDGDREIVGRICCGAIATPTATASPTTPTTVPPCRIRIRPTPAPMDWATRASRPTCSSPERRRSARTRSSGQGRSSRAGVVIGHDAVAGEQSSRWSEERQRAIDLRRRRPRRRSARWSRLGNDVVVGAGAAIESGVRVGNAVTVGDGAVIRRNAVIGNRAVIGALAVLDVGARIGRGASVETGAQVGRRAVVSPGAVVPAGASVPAGTTFP